MTTEELFAEIKRCIGKADMCVHEEDIEDAYCQALEFVEALGVHIGGLAEDRLSTKKTESRN